jgi:hypothetical protein
MEENIMKVSTANRVKRKLNEVKVATHERPPNLMNDPTLEGKDENKVGRFQRKIQSPGKGSKETRFNRKSR